MAAGALGKGYGPGEVIIRQGEGGDCVFVVQEGRVEVILECANGEVRLAVLEAGEFFGEMAVLEGQVRMATVRALGFARVLTVDRKLFLGRLHEDTSLAYRVAQTMSLRIRELNARVMQLHAA
jgi:CRP/FNR family cyclic AMP-dependent transcriptional regulator